MDLFEYQARDLFAAHGVPVLDAEVATTPDEARAAAEKLGGGTVVVKAQVKTGGRGKAGGVKLAPQPAGGGGARRRDPRHGHQGPHGAPRDGRAGREHRRGVLLLVLLDRANRTYLAMASREGGMEIEQLAVERPEALARVAGRRR